jgi:diguanylate cyclase (GGDEF)-like protein
MNEAQRLRTLRALELLDTQPEERFDRLTRLARRLFDTPIALMSLVDSDRQWFKSRPGLDFPETPRDHAFCAHAILGEGVLVVPDAMSDERFRENPLVLRFPEIRFYAGAPVRAPDGTAMGTLCVIDHEPRQIGEEDVEALQDLAKVAEQEIKSITLATIDDLTGLTNRRGFSAIANHSLAMCQRVDRPATLLLFDLNNFKLVNDTLGHRAGDILLQFFGKHLLSSFRDSDVVARLGGDEFCVLLSGATTQDIPRPLANLRESLLGEDGQARVQFSVGAATYDPEKHHAIADLVETADLQMYREKSAQQREAPRRH